MTVTEKNANTIVKYRQRGFLLNILTTEDHTNRPSIKGDIKEAITIMMTKKPPEEGQGTGPPSHLNKMFKYKIHYLLAFEFEVPFGNKI